MLIELDDHQLKFAKKVLDRWKNPDERDGQALRDVVYKSRYESDGDYLCIWCGEADTDPHDPNCPIGAAKALLAETE